MHHIEMCEAWRQAQTTKHAFFVASAIKDWWVPNVANENIKALERWFTWWEQRIAHWGAAKPMVHYYVQ